MGAWGVKLYQDDTALDIKEIYNSEIRSGKSNEEITNTIIELNKKMIEDEEEGAPIFWCILADLQWNVGRLIPEVKEKAIYYLKKGGDLSVWGEPESREYKNRKQVLEELYKKLQSPQPPEKIIKIPKPFQTDWKNGDVFYYKIRDNEKYKGKYIVVLKVCTIDSVDDNKYPSLYVYNKIFETVPKIEELINIKYMPQFYVPIAYKKYENILYKCAMNFKLRDKKSLEEFIFIENINNFELPINEKNDESFPINNYYLCNMNEFEYVQIRSYEAWKGINY